MRPSRAVLRYHNKLRYLVALALLSQHGVPCRGETNWICVAGPAGDDWDCRAVEVFTPAPLETAPAKTVGEAGGAPRRPAPAPLAPATPGALPEVAAVSAAKAAEASVSEAAPMSPPAPAAVSGPADVGTRGGASEVPMPRPEELPEVEVPPAAGEPVPAPVPAEGAAEASRIAVPVTAGVPAGGGPRAVPRERTFVDALTLEDVLLEVSPQPPPATAEYGLWSLCPDDIPPERLQAIVEQPFDPDAPLVVEADSGETFRPSLSVFTGDVRVVQSRRILRADRLRYNLDTDMASFDGSVRIDDGGLSVWAERGSVDFAADRAHLDRPRFRFLEDHARGSAATADFEGRKLSHYTDAVYTTCSESIDDWSIWAKRLTLDKLKEEGVARHATFRVKDVPVFYTPYLSFPLSDKRKTGFLVPKLGYNSDDGLDLTIPFYWNIAPNYDATIGARYIGSRGVQGQGELRFLSADGKHTGVLVGHYLPNDSSANRDRWAATVQERSSFSPGLTGSIDYSSASDKDYFKDLGNSLDVTSKSTLLQRGELAYRASGLLFRTRVTKYRIMDKDLGPSSKPYERLPQFTFATIQPFRAGPLELDATAAMDNFQHTDGNLRDQGSRIDLEPGLSLPIVGLPGFFTPRLGLTYTEYFLERAEDSTENENPNRTLPVVSVDSGLFFEKDLQLADTGFVHTLEPRLFYLYVPETSQDDIPIFDTTLPDFSAAQLFRWNRFSGLDRVGDANQLTAALTTRLQEGESGRQRLAVTAGQILYFRDRDVTLSSSQAPATQDTSSFVLGINAIPLNDWSFDANWVWDPEHERTDTANTRLLYRGNRDHILNFGYRFRRDAKNSLEDSFSQSNVNQTDVSGLWRITPHWKLVARHNYSLSDNQVIDVLGGVQYDSCCWSFRLVGRRYVRNDEGDTRESLFAQLELKGMAQLGHDVDEVLERSILGYEPGPDR
jgi:LPS-assembly protein